MTVLLKPSIRITQNGRKTFVESRGIVARRTAHYTKKFCEIYWESQSSCRASAVSAFAASRLAKSPAYLCGGHRELDTLPKMLFGAQCLRELSNRRALRHAAKVLLKLPKRNSEA